MNALDTLNELLRGFKQFSEIELPEPRDDEGGQPDLGLEAANSLLDGLRRMVDILPTEAEPDAPDEDKPGSLDNPGPLIHDLDQRVGELESREYVLASEGRVVKLQVNIAAGAAGNVKLCNWSGSAFVEVGDAFSAVNTGPADGVSGDVALLQNSEDSTRAFTIGRANLADNIGVISSTAAVVGSATTAKRSDAADGLLLVGNPDDAVENKTTGNFTPTIEPVKDNNSPAVRKGFRIRIGTHKVGTDHYPSLAGVADDGGTAGVRVKLDEYNQTLEVNEHGVTVKIDPSSRNMLLKAANGLLVMSVPAGFVQAYAGATPSFGWLPCDGTSYLRTTYAALFTAIGTTWGSVDETHFNVPDFRKRFLIGAYSGGPVLGATDGAAVADRTGISHAHGLYGLGVNTTDLGTLKHIWGSDGVNQRTDSKLSGTYETADAYAGTTGYGDGSVRVDINGGSQTYAAKGTFMSDGHTHSGGLHHHYQASQEHYHSFSIGDHIMGSHGHTLSGTATNAQTLSHGAVNWLIKT